MTLRTSGIGLALAIALIGCEAKQGTAPRERDLVPVVEDDTEKITPPLTPIHFADLDSCLQVRPGGQCVTTVTALSMAAPTLPREARADAERTMSLARALHWLDGRGEFVEDPIATADRISNWTAPPDVFESGYASWWVLDAGHASLAVELELPHWDGEVLVFDAVSLSYGGGCRASGVGMRYRASFGPNSWQLEHSELPSQLVDTTSVREQLVAAFGGPVGGFFCVTLEGRELCVAVDVGEGAKPYLYGRANARQAHASWAALARAHPSVAGPKAVAKLAGALDEFAAFSGIRNGLYIDVVYAVEVYRSPTLGSVTVGPPIMRGDTLVFHVHGRENVRGRIEVDLRALSLDRPFEFMPTPP